MTQLLRAGTANNLSAVVGFPVGNQEDVNIACCPTAPVFFDFTNRATGVFVFVEIKSLIAAQNKGGSSIFTDQEKSYLSSQEEQKRQEMKMEALKTKFKEKLKTAKKLREKIGDPIAFGRSIIEIPEDKADQKLDEVRGFKYVSKKA